MSGDPEFDDFLKRRRPLFRGDLDDGLEPPLELDRLVLRQAREAIESERPMRMFGMPRWAAPMAIAATLVLGVSIVFKTAMPLKDRVPEVTVENVAERAVIPAAAEIPPPPPAAEAQASDGAIVVDLAVSPPASRGSADVRTASAPAAAAPAWRNDARSWQAEIERLRASGDLARANAEQAEYNRQYRALAVSPDR